MKRNPIKLRKYRKKWTNKNKGKQREYAKKYRLNNRKKCNESTKRWEDKNKERSLQNRKIRISKLGANFDLNSDQLIYALFNWSKVIKERDISCVICGLSDNLHSHHIFQKSKHPKLSLNLNNGITLCQKCHHEYHKLNGFDMLIKQKS